MSAGLAAVGLSASPNGRSSHSGALLDVALLLLGAGGVRGVRHDLAALPADGLLGRARDARVDAVLDALLAADLVVVATPIYRATYSGLLKVFLDCCRVRRWWARWWFQSRRVAARGISSRSIMECDHY